MDVSRLDKLPEEIIAHIAAFTNASSVLHLSQTCRTVRSASYSSAVLKKMLRTSQDEWAHCSLHIDAIEVAASKNPDHWARWALADEKAHQLAQKECPLELPQRFLHWMPELFAVRHPLMHCSFWSRFLRDGPSQNIKQVYCQALAILASEDDMPQLETSLHMQEHSVLETGSDHKTYLWALCDIAITLRIGYRNHLAASSHKSAASDSYLPPPKASQIPIGDTLPLPFSSDSSWQSWYERQNERYFANTRNLTDFTWCGYETGFGTSGQVLDPPMVKVRFGAVDQPLDSLDEVALRADYYIDARRSFKMIGKLRRRNGEIQLSLRVHGPPPISGVWSWDLRVTPFGLVGFLNSPAGAEMIDRTGIVWLWKEEWTTS